MLRLADTIFTAEALGYCCYYYLIILLFLYFYYSFSSYFGTFTNFVPPVSEDLPIIVNAEEVWWWFGFCWYKLLLNRFLCRWSISCSKMDIFDGRISFCCNICCYCKIGGGSLAFSCNMRGVRLVKEDFCWWWACDSFTTVHLATGSRNSWSEQHDCAKTFWVGRIIPLLSARLSPYAVVSFLFSSVGGSRLRDILVFSFEWFRWPVGGTIY